MNFLLIDGEGAPTSLQYIEAVESLYSAAYTIKFTLRKDKEIDYEVMALEGLWWMNDMTQFTAERKNDWKWTAMIMQPEIVNINDFKSAIEQAKKKKNLPPSQSYVLKTLRRTSCANHVYRAILE